ncbi:MAG: AAA family ATPase [Actinomycetes bacterium]
MVAPRSESFLLRAVEWPSPLDARRGVVRISGETMSLLGLRPWDPLRLQGRRLSGALVAVAPPGTDSRVLLCDELTLRNVGLTAGRDVEVRRATEQPTRRLALAGPPELVQAVPPEVLRLALLGKVVTHGDEVSLLSQDFAVPEGSDPASRGAARRRLASTLGADEWQSLLLLVTGAEPAEPSIVTMGTVVGWAEGASTTGQSLPLVLNAGAAPTTHPSRPASSVVPPFRQSAIGVPPPVAPASATATAPPSVPGLEEQAADLREWLDLGFHGRELLARLGGSPQLGILVSGPPGSGKASLVEGAAAAVGARLRRLWAPRLAGLDATSAARELAQAAEAATGESPSVLLVEDVEALAERGPESPGPLAQELLETVRRLVAAGRVAVVCTTTRPEAVSPRLREPGLLDRELVVPLPNRDQRHRMLEEVTRAMPLTGVDLDEVVTRTPGFVLADLVALAREAAVRAAHRHRAAGADESRPVVGPDDFAAALDVVRPTAMQSQSLELPELTLDDVGDMAEVKRVLTETVVWPLTYPDTFDRLGVQAPHGALLYGPPGCGKTFLVRALAGTGRANVLSVKGAELLSKWVGESERGVRELFRRARHAAPAIVFLDEVDALAPARGQSSDSGVSDRVVAALLTELDGIEGLRDVCVIGATNRPDLIDPALLRPGRLDRLVHVPPPDPAAREEILMAAARRTPVADDVDLAGLARGCDGFSAADCAALVREAALAAMRESLATPVVTAAHFAAARRTVRPSLRPEQLAALEAFAASRG